jgi:hypothetical protein
VQGNVSIQLAPGSCPAGVNRAQLEQALNQALAALLAKLTSVDSLNVEQMNRELRATLRAEVASAAESQEQSMREYLAAITKVINDGLAASRPALGTQTLSILIDCRPEVLPTKVIGDVNALDTWPSVLSAYATHFVTGDKANEPRLWPSGDMKTRFGQKCLVTNYSSVPVAAVAMTFVLNFRESVSSGDSPSIRSSGRVVLSRERPIQVPVIENGRSFTLYVHNPSEFFVDVLVPETATVTAAGIASRQTVRLMQTWAQGRPSFPLVPDR